MTNLNPSTFPIQNVKLRVSDSGWVAARSAGVGPARQCAGGRARHYDDNSKFLVDSGSSSSMILRGSIILAKLSLVATDAGPGPFGAARVGSRWSELSPAFKFVTVGLLVRLAAP